jgi:antitoxin component YwqK of YwqJK toxin-antitoxin module/Flp pilus assembly protein TadD/lysophospholipase L1-like esterase
MSNKPRKHNRSSRKHEHKQGKPTTTFLQAVIIVLVAVGLFFGLLEGGLALLGVKPVIRTEDPFVGFAANVPLFVPAQDSEASGLMVTAANKTSWFNRQDFPRDKSAGSYRIFCLGGSTTYGRPYNDSTSFAGWLRELLPAADGAKNWEVINAGGISYASYRVAHLMEELITYQPDLFIIYTGHNEFLEERTYRKLRQIPSVVQSTVSLLAHTRTWTTLESMLQSAGIATESQHPERDTLAAEVDSKLRHTIGPASYTRDDSLREQILEHYRISLERMVSLARSVGAQVIFVTPAANLKDSSPFKSEHTDNLPLSAIQQTEELLTQAKAAIEQEQWDVALQLLDKAVAIDPRDAEIQYRRGKVLLALERYQEAETSLRRARDEDVCPLRALTPMREIVTEVARDNGVAVVDYVGLIEDQMLRDFGQPVPGQEFFLDHVHPTIEGHKILALALIQTMTEQGLVHPGADWGPQVVSKVAAKIEGGVDQNSHGLALANLARVLFWGGKEEDAARLANQAMETAGDDVQVATNATDTLVKYSLRQGDLERAHQQLIAALEDAPNASELHLKLGKLLGARPYLKLAEAAAHLLLACQQMPDNSMAHQLFGQTMAWRGRPRIAYASLQEALRLNPGNEDARKIQAQIKPLLGEHLAGSTYQVSVERYPHGGPEKLVQLEQDGNGHAVADGIAVEFYENGRVKRLVDYVQGVKSGMEIIWDDSGQELSLVVAQQGDPVDFARVRRQLYEALAKDPESVKTRLQLGKILMDSPFLQVDESAAQLLLACQQQPNSDVAFQLFGQAMVRRGRPDIAYPSLQKALQLNPGNQVAQKTLTAIAPVQKDQPQPPATQRLQLDNYPSGAPRKLVQKRQLADGRSVPDGIAVEYHENGRVKRLVDFDQGIQNGLEMTWDENGRLLSCVVFLNGTPSYGNIGS